MKTKKITAKSVFIVTTTLTIVALVILCWSSWEITGAWLENLGQTSTTVAERIINYYSTWPAVMVTIFAFWLSTGYWIAAPVAMVFGFAAFISGAIWKGEIDSYVG